MNHLVQENPAAGFQIFPRRRRWIPADRSELINPSDQVPIDLPASFRIARVEPSLETNLEWNPAFFDQFQSFLRPLQIEGHRLFAKHCFEIGRASCRERV